MNLRVLLLWRFGTQRLRADERRSASGRRFQEAASIDGISVLVVHVHHRLRAFPILPGIATGAKRRGEYS